MSEQPRQPRPGRRSSTLIDPGTHGAPVFDLAGLMADRGVRIVVCCGSGGVGKTTTAAALAVHAAERGRRVVVLTIDPARRLAQSLGLTELDNTPRAVQGIDTSAGGSLDAMMLDMKRTFDDVVSAHTKPEKAAQIFANPFYEALSSSFAGTQEYMAMEKLGQLHALTGDDGRPAWDLIVVDTPPSRSALDFLDAPSRLGSFLDGRLIKVLVAPAKAGGRVYTKVVGAGLSVASGALSKVLGTGMLEDVRGLVTAMDTMFGGFRERADVTFSLLQRPETAFVVVTSPERDALREAGYFVDRLEADAMPLAGAVVNRVRQTRTDAISVDAALTALPGPPPGEGQIAWSAAQELLEVHAEVAAEARLHERLTDAFASRHPTVALRTVPIAATDIHDLDGLRTVGAHLTGV